VIASCCSFAIFEGLRRRFMRERVACGTFAACAADPQVRQ